MTVSRRDFLALSAAATTSLAAPGRDASPLVVASANGLAAVDKAFKMITEHGADPLDAAIAGVNILELDPEDQSVGLGGLPNEHGIVQLDASCMHGPTKRAGAVAALEDVALASRVAKAVMDYTDHVMLAGEGASRFALDLGFEKQNLLTAKSRQDWLRWKAQQNPDDSWLDHDGEVEINGTHGTVNCCALDAKGDIGSVTTTSGRSWKLPGRVGDSPIIGAGQYCDNEVGAAGSTGRGEAVIKVCGAFLVVEHMRLGKSPQEACMYALERVAASTEPRLLDGRGRPKFHLQFYALSKDGRHGGATLYKMDAEHGAWGISYAVADRDGARLVPLTALYEGEKP